MSTYELCVKAVNGYVERMAAGDAAGLVALYASDASFIDPVGTPAHVGTEALTTWFDSVVQMAPKPEIAGAIRVAGGQAAVPITIRVEFDGNGMVIDVIELFTVNDEGLIIDQKVWWGEQNVSS